MPSANQHAGNRGEMIAKAYLERQGLCFLDHQWRCRYGEIDLIMQEGDELVFIEVKFRAGNSYGHPEDMITYSKTQKLIRTAKSYLLQKRLENIFWRFDTIAITGNVIDHEIVHLKDTIRED